MIRLLPIVMLLVAQSDKHPPDPRFDYEAARAHEIKPLRHSIPLQGVRQGQHQLHLSITLSLSGDVIDVMPSGEDDALRFWPKVQGEVRKWKFLPFEASGKAIRAQVEEYIDLVPPERLPKKIVAPPPIRPDSRVIISLERSGCYGACPSYKVTVGTNGIVFEGHSFVVASGRHADQVDAEAVRLLAKRFVAENLYSMGARYVAMVTDNPTYSLSIDIDGHTKEVLDYVGAWVGMPAIITDLEEEVDRFAGTERWIQGNKELVPALHAEGFDFHSIEAQWMLKRAASRGKTGTVKEFLEAGVPLEPAPRAAPDETRWGDTLRVGWLGSASLHLDVLRVFLDAGASNRDQNDKDMALGIAARSGNVGAVRALIDYGANPGSVLIEAVASGNPEMVREILRFHPKVDSKDNWGKPVMFAVGGYDRGVEGGRVECLRLLVEAGADVNARDRDGNTPLHNVYPTEVAEEFLRLGADVNVRNKDGETPIFTTADHAVIPVFIKYGADLTIRNNKGETLIEDAKRRWGPARLEALRKAIQQQKPR